MKRVLLETRDLIFRAKLGEVVKAAGGEVVRDVTQCDLAVVELGGGGAGDGRIRELVARGVKVVAFGSHVAADALRAARETGAVAVPNSQIEARLREMLGEQGVGSGGS